MKRHLGLVVLLVPAMLSAQVTVKGIVTEQNSGNKPLAGVQIKVLGTTPDQTGRDGLFQLVFSGREPGDRIIVSEIVKKGYEIVNKDLVDNWVIQKEPAAPFKIVMCPAGMIAKNTMRYYNISLDGLTRGYEARIKALQQQKEKAEIDARTYGEQARLLSEQYKNQQKQLAELSEKFARENFDDCSAVHRQAFEAFKAGNISEALRLLESVDSWTEIEKARKQRGKAEGIISEGTRMLQQSDTIIRQHIAKLKFQSDLYINELRFEEALKAREAAMKADSTDLANVHEYALFLQRQNLYAESEHWFTLALSLATNGHDRSSILLNLGKTDRALSAFDKAEGEFKEALQIRKAMTMEDNADYIKNLSVAGFDLAQFYFEVHQFSKMDSLISEMLVLLEGLQKTQPDAARIPISLNKGILGHLYAELGRDQEAIACYNDAVALMRLHGMPVEESGLRDLATALNSLGIVQGSVRMYEVAETNLLESLKISRDLARMNPQRYNRDLAVTLFNVAKFYMQINEAAEAEKYIQEAVELLTDLYDKYPMVYGHDLAKLLAMRAQILRDRKEFIESEKDHLEAIRIMRELSALNPEVYRPDLAKILQSFGYFKSIRNQYEQAEACLVESLEIYNNLGTSNLEAYYPLAAGSMHLLSRLYGRQGLHEKAKDYEKQTLAAYRKLDSLYPNSYEYDIARVLVDLSATCCLLNEKDESRATIEEFRSILQGLIVENPAKYTLLLADQLGRYASICYKNDLEDAVAKASEAAAIYSQFDDTLLARQSMAAQCFNMMSHYMALSEEYAEAEKHALMALQLAPGEPWIRKNLAHSYLLQGKYDEASRVYLELKGLPSSDPTKTYGDLILDDFNEFEKKGITHPDVEKIKALLTP